MSSAEQPTTATRLLVPGLEPLPGYRLVARLGGGGFGEVWKAEHAGFHVALKFVRLEDKAGPVEMHGLDLIRELHHPNLVHTFGAWQIEGYLIIAMELAGGSLWDRFHERRSQGLAGIPRDELLDYFAEAARGIDYFNDYKQAGLGPESGVQHRDIKPQNILLVGGGVKIADFGLARALEHSLTTHTGGMTPAYAAPEFFDGRTSRHSDQYCPGRVAGRFRSQKAHVSTGGGQMCAKSCAQFGAHFDRPASPRSRDRGLGRQSKRFGGDGIGRRGQFQPGRRK
jgi:serine/threonine protein kinase